MLTKGFITELTSPHVQNAQQHVTIISNIYIYIYIKDGVLSIKENKTYLLI